MTFPNMFSTLVAQGGNPAAGGYPYQIRAEDLDKNFVMAALDADATLVQEFVGANGHQGRRLKIPPIIEGNNVLASEDGEMSWKAYFPDPPNEGTYVLGAIDGVIQWIATEEC
jgi:hypothetical protein